MKRTKLRLSGIREIEAQYRDCLTVCKKSKSERVRLYMQQQKETAAERAELNREAGRRGGKLAGRGRPIGSAPRDAVPNQLLSGEVAAARVGMGRRTAERLSKIVDLADKGHVHAKVALTAIDRGKLGVRTAVEELGLEHHASAERLTVEQKEGVAAEIAMEKIRKGLHSAALENRVPEYIKGRNHINIQERKDFETWVFHQINLLSQMLGGNVQ